MTSYPIRPWGRLPSHAARTATHYAGDDSIGGINGTVLPFGNGRSYGDSCLSTEGTLLLTRQLDKFIVFDRESGQLECEAGVLLSEILDVVMPHGWFLPVTPGTKFITVGGAIANDIHGKNHHVAGSFGHHITRLSLRRGDGSAITCSPLENTGMFKATIGGLGLTGLITQATIQLKRVPGPNIWTSTRRFSGLDDFFRLSADLAEDEYLVAWVDVSGKQSARRRGVFFSGNHRAGGPRIDGTDTRRFNVPVAPPVSMVGPLSTRVFSSLYFFRAPRDPAERFQSYDSFFYPLDALGNWNRLYGRNGFYQYQCVLPAQTAKDALDAILSRIEDSRQGSFLTVLKQFGSASPAGLLSFPRRGTTFAIDFPNRGQKTLELLDALDQITLSAGGAIYPAKDARMSPAMFAASFPELDTFKQYADPKFSSDFWQRVGHA